MMTRRYTFKLYPNVAQAAALEQQRALHSALYNALLQQRIEAYARGQWTLAPTADGQRLKRGRTLTKFDQGKGLTDLRAEFPEYAALSRGSMEQTAKRVDLAFKAFFRRAKQGAGVQSGFPRFKRCEGFGMRELAKGGWRLETRPDVRDGRTRAEARRLVLQGVPGRIRLRGRFPGVPAAILTCDLTLAAGVWWLSVVVQIEARLRADASHSGEVEFDLVDSFARVRRVDGKCGAGPAETVYAAANGRISAREEEVIDNRVPSPSETGESAGVEPFSFEAVEVPSPSETGESAGSCALCTTPKTVPSPSETGESAGDAAVPVAAVVPSPSETGESAGEQLAQQRSGTVPSPSETGESAGGRADAARPRGVPSPSETGESAGAAAEQPVRDRVPSPSEMGESAGKATRCHLLDPVPSPSERGESAGARRTRPPREGQAGVIVAPGDRSAAMARCRRGSCRYRKLRRLKARAEARVARQRREALHVWTTRLARRFAALRIITPPVREVTESGRGDAREPGGQVAFKAELNRRVLDQSPAMAAAMLAYKLAERGGTTETVVSRALDVAAGNTVVAAHVENRKLRKAARRAQRSRRVHPDVQKSP